MPRLDEVHLDGLALLFSCVVTMLTGIGFGLVPALQATKVDLTIALKEGGRSSGDGRQRSRLRNILVITEVALALVLLIGAGLLTRTFSNLQKVNMGYDGEVVHATRVMLLPEEYPDDQARLTFTDRALEQMAREPEFIASAFSIGLPYFGAMGGGMDIEESPVADNNLLPRVVLCSITPDYFKVMGKPLLRGRGFNARDRANTPLVAIISEKVVREQFAGENPLGKRIAMARNTEPREWREIVGVVGDMRMRGAAQDASPGVYVPLSQYRTFRTLTPIVRVRPGARNPGPSVGAAIQAVDPSMPIERHMVALAEYDGNSVATQKFALFLFGIFSSVALLLAALGIYGVMSYTVSQRTNEIGVRMALGAQQGDILRLIVTSAAKLVSIGVLIGVAGAIAGSRLLSSILYDISPHDPVTFISIVILLALVAALACYIPALRATKVDPMVALRTD